MQPIKPAFQHSGAVRAVAYSPDGRTIFVGGHDRIAQLWDLKTETPRGAAVMRHPDAVKKVAFSPDGRLGVTVSWDQVRLWDAETGEPSAHLCRISRKSSTPHSALMARSFYPKPRHNSPHLVNRPGPAREPPFET